MIKKLRMRFIRLTMLSVFAVLLLILVAINGANLYQSNRSADSITKMLFDRGGTFDTTSEEDVPEKPDGDGETAPEKPDGETVPEKPDGDEETAPEKPDANASEAPAQSAAPAEEEQPEPPKDDGNLGGRMHNEEELPFSTRYFTITFDADGEILSYDLSNIASVDEDEVETYADAIFAKDRTVGWYKTYRYRLGETDDGYLLIVMDATDTRSAIFSVLGITFIVALAAFIVIFVLVTLFSKRAIRPISETYQKQRQFITDAGHELKTPLTVITADAEILGMTYGENEWTSGIIRQSAQMRTLIGKMIQMSKLDEGGQTLEFLPFSISDAVYDTALSFASVAQAKGCTLAAEVAPSLTYCGDEAAIRQVVAILVDNAVKYSDANGQIGVTLSKAGKSFGKEKLTLRVVNPCTYAATLDTNRLFDRFYRADKAHTANNSYGLGLSIAHAIVTQHGGKIRAQAEGESVVFTVSL